MKILMIMGASGSGKSYLERKLTQLPNFKKVISFTTRESRSGEIDGNDYYFISKEKYLDLKNQGLIIQETHFANSIYGSFLSEYIDDKINTLCVVPLEGLKLKEKMEKLYNAEIKVIYYDISKNQLIENMKKRGDSIEMIEERMKKDNLKEEFKISKLHADLIIKDHDLNESLIDKVKKLF